MWVTKQLLVHLIVGYKQILWNSLGTSNGLVFHIQLKGQVQLMKLLIIRKDVARPSAQLAVVLLLNIQWVLIKHLWCYQVKKLISSPGAKYADLVEDCREAGWKATMCPVEVGCRGFVGLGFGMNH